MNIGVGATGFVVALSMIGTAECLQARFGAQYLSSENTDPLSLAKDESGLEAKCAKYSCDQIQYDEATQKWAHPRPEFKSKGWEFGIWRRLHKKDISDLQKAANASVANSMVLLGDSITEGLGRQHFSPRQYGGAKPYGNGPAPSGAHLASGAVPFAIGGDRIQDLAYRLFQYGGMDAVKTLAPKTVVLLIGTNDFGQEESVEVAKKEMEIFVKQLQAELPPDTKLVLQAPLPRGRQPCRETGRGACSNQRGKFLLNWDASNPAHVFHNQLADVLKNAASGSQTTSFLDCTHAFMGDGTALSTIHLSEDLLHPSKEGYRAWASCIEQATGVQVLGEAFESTNLSDDSPKQ